MKIAVLGGGHGSYASAAALSENGHEISLWRRDQKAFEDLLNTQTLRLVDLQGERDVKLKNVTDNLAEAVAGKQLIVIPLPAIAHVELAEQLAPVLEDGQVVFLPPGTFGSYVLAKAMKDAGNDANVSFVETGTLPYLTRKQGPSTVRINVYATRLPSGVFPACNTSYALDILKEVYPAVEEVEDALSGALMNAGPIIHTPLIMMNAAALEHFETWDIHNEGTQPTVRRVTDRLDKERIAIREAFGYKAPHFPLSDNYRMDGDEWMYGRDTHKHVTASNDWREDIDLTRHRYMLEDVELGLAFLASCADYAGVDAPLIKGMLAMGSAIVGRDFRQSGRTLENLSLADIDRDSFSHLLHNGL